MAPALNAPLILRGTLVRGEGPIWRQDQQSVVLPEAVTRTALSPPGHWPSLQGAVHSAQPGGPGSRVRPATVPLSRWGSVAVRNQEDVEASWLGPPWRVTPPFLASELSATISSCRGTSGVLPLETLSLYSTQQLLT